MQGEEEDEETDSDGYDNWDFYNDENEGKDKFDNIPRDHIVQLTCGKYHAFHSKCLMMWVDGQKLRTD